MFAQLLQNLGSYLDFSKRLATTVPGLVMALALAMLTATAPDWVRKPFTCEAVRDAKADWRDAARQLETSGPDDLLSRVLRAKESALRRAYYKAVNGAEAATEQADAATVALQRLQAFYAGEGKALVDKRPTLTGDAKTADAKLDEDDRKLAESEYNDLCKESPTTWNTIAGDLLMFGLLGFTLGVVLDPVNKAIFLQALPEMVAPKADLDRVAQPDAKSQGRSKGAFLARIFVPLEHAQKRHPKLLREHSPQFYIGRGVITAGEYQDLIDNYYRFCEVTTGLVIPVALVGLALVIHYWSKHAWPQAVLSAVLSVSGSVLLARIGVRRYAEFRIAASEMIEGRIDQMREARQKAGDSRIDIVQLQTLVHQADQIMGWWFRRENRGEE